MRLHIAINHRVDHAFREYASTFAYLYVCFGALLLFKAAVLRGHGIDYAPYGLAVAKALLLAKFMLIGRKLRFGAKFRGGTLMHAVAYKSMLFLLLLIALSAVEEVIVYAIHRRTLVGIVAEMVSGRLGQIIAESLLLLLILVPYFAYRELDTALGEGTIRRLLRRPAGPR